MQVVKPAGDPLYDGTCWSPKRRLHRGSELLLSPASAIATTFLSLATSIRQVLPQSATPSLQIETSFDGVISTSREGLSDRPFLWFRPAAQLRLCYRQEGARLNGCRCCLTVDRLPRCHSRQLPNVKQACRSANYADPLTKLAASARIRGQCNEYLSAGLG